MVLTQEMLETDDLEQSEQRVDRMLYLLLPAERRARPRVWHPPTDVYETDDTIVIKIEIAGMNVEDFRITLANRLLTVSGVRHDRDAKSNCHSCHRLEIHYGEFLSQIYLSGNYQAERIEAQYVNGLLYITIPKVKHEHRIPVRVSTPA
jgi:HSP20 family protein